MVNPNASDTQPLHKPNIPNDATVLVVEDNVSNFVLIARMLGYLGIHCEWKTSGFEVVEYADTLPRLDRNFNGHPPALRRRIRRAEKDPRVRTI